MFVWVEGFLSAFLPFFLFFKEVLHSFGSKERDRQWERAGWGSGTGL